MLAILTRELGLSNNSLAVKVLIDGSKSAVARTLLAVDATGAVFAENGGWVMHPWTSIKGIAKL